MEEVAESVHRLLQQQWIVFEDRSQVAQALALYVKHQGSIGLTDALIGIRNQAAGCEVTATFDEAAQAIRHRERRLFVAPDAALPKRPNKSKKPH